jgi:hypothetical protein
VLAQHLSVVAHHHHQGLRESPVGLEGVEKPADLGVGGRDLRVVGSVGGSRKA